MTGKHPVVLTPESHQRKQLFLTNLEQLCSTSSMHFNITALCFSLVQVQCYKDHHCYNSTDRRILNMFITICSDLRNLCQKLEKVHPGDSVTNGLLEKCKVLLNDSNDFTALRAT